MRKASRQQIYYKKDNERTVGHLKGNNYNLLFKFVISDPE